jgi:hypothetical protein
MMKEKIKPIYCFLIVTIFIFHYKIGITNVIPTNVDWLLQAADWPQHYLGWEFFRRTPWGYPLGEFSNLLYPVATNIGFTDSIPLLAISLKLFNLVLPDFFQYIGLWIFINILLQAYLGYLIFRKLNFSIMAATSAGIIMQLTPALIARLNHPALTAHWLILLAIYNYLSFESKKKDIYLNFLAIILSSLIHPYLAIMIIPISLANLWRFKSWPKIIILTIVGLIIPIILWAGIGYFVDYSIGDPQNLGYYSTSLQSFFNPEYAIWDNHLKDASLWLDSRGIRYPSQYEGFAYLGLGVLSGIILTIAMLLIKTTIHTEESLLTIKTIAVSLSKERKIFFIICIILISLYSIIHKDNVTYLEQYNNILIIDMFLEKSGVIRANGRFIWPLMYIVIIITLYGIQKIFKKHTFYILTILALIQVVDITPLIKERLFRDQEFVSIKSESSIFWKNTIKDYKTVNIYPGGQRSYNRADDYIIFAFWAAQNNIPINAGYLSRYDIEISRKFNLELEKNLNNNNLDKNSLYITTKDYKTLFQNISQNTSRELVEYDNYYILK